MKGNVPAGSVRLLQLPEDVLLRVLRALARDGGTIGRDNLRDLWNVATTCSRLYALTVRMMQNLCTTSMLLDEGVLRNVVSRVPNDVVQGTLLSLRSKRGGSQCAALRVVRLSAMAPVELQAALNRLSGCSSLRELCFVDAGGGVRLPDDVARLITTLSITSPRACTLKALHKARCAPKILRLCCVSDDVVFTLQDVWVELTHKSVAIDVTWSGSLVPSYEYDKVCFLPERRNVDLERVQLDSQHRRVPLGPQYSTSFRYTDDDGAIEGPLGWKPVEMCQWCDSSSEREQLRLDMTEEEGLLTVVLAHRLIAEDLRENDDDLMKMFVRDMVMEFPIKRRKWNREDEEQNILYSHDVVGGGCGRVDKLQIIVPLYCRHMELLAAEAAALLAAKVAAAGVHELVVSTVVFMELVDVVLPGTLRSIGIVDVFTDTTFLDALPAMLEKLVNGSAASGVRRSVWMECMRLRDDGGALRTEAVLKRAEEACRRAEMKGLCAAGVRGVIEHWMRERESSNVYHRIRVVDGIIPDP
ncbi:hypothetical protein FGB62_218g06 [Gracilaria domingensis]|nr:hypothetical protein FGB62_218g06 [Gracilaria domingensis]